MEFLYGVLITIGVIVGILVVGFIVVIAVGLNAYYKTEMGIEALEKSKRKKR